VRDELDRDLIVVSVDAADRSPVALSHANRVAASPQGANRRMIGKRSCRKSAQLFQQRGPVTRGNAREVPDRASRENKLHVKLSLMATILSMMAAARA
jgi:hypothetical protein